MHEKRQRVTLTCPPSSWALRCGCALSSMIITQSACQTDQSRSAMPVLPSHLDHHLHPLSKLLSKLMSRERDHPCLLLHVRCKARIPIIMLGKLRSSGTSMGLIFTSGMQTISLTTSLARCSRSQLHTSDIVSSPHPPCICLLLCWHNQLLHLLGCTGVQSISGFTIRALPTSQGFAAASHFTPLVETSDCPTER